MNLTWLEFVIAGLATYRLSLLFSKEHGMFGLFSKLRKAPPKHSETSKWLSCLWCFSMTASAFVCVLLWFAGARENWVNWFLIWSALSSVAIALNQSFTREN